MSQILPLDKKQLRACLLCSLIKNASQFRANGCENCDDILQMRGSMDRVLECTSPKFEGCITSMQPEHSWVAKWQRINKFHEGIYAIVVYGRIPDDVEDELDRRGITFKPRDGSVKE
ncbi:Spt4/RpoE2 zinc finger-domain-containing protein [Mycotypha africana]|uniref:Spt4/RpoE2 zinc finger-domain-containing protein n=1 Tax=Mycotypha africana TaxID=64632 RepID=UPI002300C851|nr:Spt4/RpoE2 zinc finger-domain-containing protein [Mycotypha africana]KAI8988075.1 Spt4/RpoE2 zinc finger-domain-containing protein [Mycotypha africana]